MRKKDEFRIITEKELKDGIVVYISYAEIRSEHTGNWLRIAQTHSHTNHSPGYATEELAVEGARKALNSWLTAHNHRDEVAEYGKVIHKI